VGGRLPGKRLRRLRGTALTVARLDRSLVDALAQTDRVTQRDIARWVTRRAFVEARLADVEWIAPALAAMDRGEPLPPPFDDDRRAWDLLLSDGRVPRTLVTSPDAGWTTASSRRWRSRRCSRRWNRTRCAPPSTHSGRLRWHSATAGTRCCSARSARPFPRSRHTRNTERAHTGRWANSRTPEQALGKAKLWHKRPWVALVDGDLRPGGEFRARFTSGWEGPGRVDVGEPLDGSWSRSRPGGTTRPSSRPSSSPTATRPVWSWRSASCPWTRRPGTVPAGRHTSRTSPRTWPVARPRTGGRDGPS
jgi:hypothetical protein